MAALFITLAFVQQAPTAILVLALIGIVDGTTDVLFDTIVHGKLTRAATGAYSDLRPRS